VHPTTGRHAHAKTAAEITVWQGRRFVSRGVAFAVGTSAVVLLAAGYVEVSSLGWGLYDEGRVRTPKTVVRYRRASDGATLHSMMPDAELSLAGYDSDGKKFRLLPEPNGWTLPLLRLRTAAGFEAMSTSLSDAATLQAQGYALEGIAGWLQWHRHSRDRGRRHQLRPNTRGRREHGCRRDRRWREGRRCRAGRGDPRGDATVPRRRFHRTGCLAGQRARYQ
jgi:hypothetical protein